MARPRQPVELIIANGKKHLTKDEIAERRAAEVAPCTDDLDPPSYLTAAEKKRFEKLVGQLVKIKIMGETDVETLARYVSAQTLYEDATKELRKLKRERPSKDAYEKTGREDWEDRYFVALDIWTRTVDSTAKLQDRYFKQAQTAARDLGLTITSRCKLVAPIKDEAPPENKFARFNRGAG